MIVLGTDVLIEIYDKKSRQGERALEKIASAGEDVGITSINLHEILFGLQKHGKSVGEILRLPVLSYTKADAALSAELELKAERSGRSIRRTDAMIAAVVINNCAKLYTLDRKRFKTLESLGLELFE
jgi:predicted nucleic acid-binding protein